MASWNINENEIPEQERIEKTLRQKRIEICNSCENLSMLKMCKVCHCFMPIKTMFKIFNCPLEKW